MKILVLNREHLDKIPPLISVIKLLNELGHEIEVVTGGISDGIFKDFELNGIKMHIIPHVKMKNYIEKVSNIFSYRKSVADYLKNTSYDVIWIEGYGVFRWLYDVVKDEPYIMQISELYDLDETKKVKKNVGKLIKNAKAIVMPEINRATLYQVEYGLERRPFVLPNKPYFYLSDNNMEKCLVKYAKDLEVFKEKKIILYQGIIAEERDLSTYVKAVKQLGDEFRLVLLGPDWGMLEKYKQIDENLIHIDFIAAPEYLVFTANAYIGLVSYEPKTLNCAYCAPNKIYEYARYSLPMLANDIPGLKYTIEKYQAGVIVDEKSVNDIVLGIRKIDEEYSLFAQNSKHLYDDTNNLEVIKQIMEYVANKSI